MFNKNLITFIILLACQSLVAQQDLGTSFLTNTWQINYTNPARTPANMKVAISLPGAYSNVSSPLSLNNLISSTETGNLLDIENAVNKLRNNNRIFLNAHAHSFNIAIAVKKLTISVGHVVRVDFGIKFPKTLAEVAWNGNAPYVGNELEIAPNISLNLYNEYNLGVAYNMGNLTLGGKVKLLAGIANVSSKNSSIELTSSDDVYQLNFKGDYTIRTAGFFETDPDNGMQVNEEMVKQNLLFSNNIGMAFDIGATYKFSEQLTLSASLLDVGGMVWEDLTNVYNANGEAQFEGINLISYTQDFDLSFDEKKDSILNLFNVSQEEKSYFARLPVKAYLSADYELNKWVTLGGLLYLEDYQRNLNAALSANATVHLGKILDVGASYSIKSNSFSNIGLSTVLNLGPVQFLAMTDNILAVFTPQSQRNANLRVGLNLIFRERKEKEEKTKKNKNSYYKNVPSVDCPSPKQGKKKR